MPLGDFEGLTVALLETVCVPEMLGVPDGVNVVPPAGIAFKNVTFAGSASVTSTFVAVAVPLLVSVTV